MKVFVIKSILFTVILALSIALLSKLEYYKKLPTSNYMAAIEFKHARVDSLSKAGHVIAIGGSSLPFGLNSKKIQAHFDLPTTNLGLHAGLGYSFILNEVKSILKPNHILIVSWEPTMSEGGEYDLKNNTCRYYPEACNYFTLSQNQLIMYKVESAFKNFQSNIDYLIWSFSKNKASSVYSLESFNEFGDMVANQGRRKKIDPDRTFGSKSSHAKSMAQALNELNDYCKKLGVKCFYTPCPIANSYYSKTEGAFKTFYTTFQDELKMEIVGNYEDFVFPDSLFFDTEYHLNQKGAQKRTALLINAMVDAGIQ